MNRSFYTRFDIIALFGNDKYPDRFLGVDLLLCLMLVALAPALLILPRSNISVPYIFILLWGGLPGYKILKRLLFERCNAPRYSIEDQSNKKPIWLPLNLINPGLWP